MQIDACRLFRTVNSNAKERRKTGGKIGKTRKLHRIHMAQILCWYKKNTYITNENTKNFCECVFFSCVCGSESKWVRMSACMFDCDCCVLLVNVYAKIDIQNISTTKYRRYLIVSKLEKKSANFIHMQILLEQNTGQIKQKQIHSSSELLWNTSIFFSISRCE